VYAISQHKAGPIQQYNECKKLKQKKDNVEGVKRSKAVRSAKDTSESMAAVRPGGQTAPRVTPVRRFNRVKPLGGRILDFWLTARQPSISNLYQNLEKRVSQLYRPSSIINSNHGGRK
jgi:hypothetical protein